MRISPLAKLVNNPWPIGIVSFFLLLSIWHSWLLFTAFSGGPDKVSLQPYQESLMYEQTIDRRKVANQVLLKHSIDVSPISNDDSRHLIQVTLGVVNNAKLNPTVMLRLKRADTAVYDQEISLAQNVNAPSSSELGSSEIGSVVFEGTALFPVRGLWLATLSFQVNGESAELSEHLRIP